MIKSIKSGKMIILKRLKHLFHSSALKGVARSSAESELSIFFREGAARARAYDIEFQESKHLTDLCWHELYCNIGKAVVNHGLVS